MPNRGHPTYNLKEVKRIVENDEFTYTQRVAEWITNHYEGEDPREIIRDVFSFVEETGFRKTMQLDKRPDVKADVYGVNYDDITWYLKFFVDDENKVRVRVWSCCWDNTLH